MSKTYKKDLHEKRPAFKKFSKKGGTQPPHGGKMGPVHKVAGKIGQPGAATKPNGDQPDPLDDGFNPEE